MSEQPSFPEEFYKYDSFHYKKYFQSYPEDLRTSYNRSLRPVLENIKFSRIIITGSSWSLNAAKIAGDYLEGSLDLLFAESYSETIKIKSDDLVIVISYSGNGEEASAWLKHARRASAKTIILTSGGRLTEDSFDTTVIDLTKGLPSRCSSFTIIGTLLRLFEDAALIPNQASEIQQAVDFLRSQSVFKLAEELSSKLYGVIPLIYSSSTMKNSAKRFKMLVNANAKTTAFFNVLPGADYYEGESFLTKNASFHALLISSSSDISRLKKKITVFKNALQSQGVSVTELNIKGKGLVSTITSLLIGDVTSYYLALRYKQDPLKENVSKKIKTDMGIFI